MNEVLELAKLSEKVDEIRAKIHVENTANNPFLDAYNDGIDAMTAQVQKMLNEMALKKAFGGGQ